MRLPTISRKQTKKRTILGLSYNPYAEYDLTNELRAKALSHYENALLVDAWVGIKIADDGKKQRYLVLQNNSSSAIRNVSLFVIWNDAAHINVPGNDNTWRVLPQGTWKIQRASSDKAYKWKGPSLILSDFSLIQ